jgi:hypothetical protein
MSIVEAVRPRSARGSAPDREAVQAAIDARRAESERRFREVIARPDAIPALRITGDCPDRLATKIKEADRCTVVVSFHTKAYFLLFVVLKQMGLRATVVTTPGIAARFPAQQLSCFGDVRFITALTPAELRRCMREKRALFIMADVLIAYGSNAPLPILGRAMRYTISWAELATKHRLNVAIGLIRDRGTEADVLLRDLGVATGSAYDLACEACDTFEDFIAEDVDAWENYPALEAFGWPMPDLGLGLQPPLMETLSGLCMCDVRLARALREGAHELAR